MHDRMQQLSLVDELTEVDATSYQLCQLEVYNWGPFCGFHRATFHPQGAAIIGPTGSGKTTLVDALMTLLVGQPRYNLASTGGHESDRTLISYVRGVLGGDGSDGREEVARPGKTITGICATYRSAGETLRLGGLLWTEGVSSAAADLKRRWLFSQADDQSLEQWLRLLHEEGVRELMRTGRETARLRIFDSKKAYLAHVRKFFDVGENAFTLLNRAAGLKQLNSIDEIFRDLVLDDRAAFDRALEVAGEFDNLAGIHAELETARRQRESLVPVAAEHEKLIRARKKADRLATLKRVLSIWFAGVAVQKWSAVLDQLARERDEASRRLEQLRESEATNRSRVEAARERYLELGGNVIGELEKTIDLQKERVAEKARHAADYRRIAGALGLNDRLDREALRHNQAQLRERRPSVVEEREGCQEAALSALSQQRTEEAKRSELEAAIEKVRERPGSNIPPRFQDFRAELAAELSLPERDLPFLAELIEVKSEQAAWRGAIERAVGSERLRVLVPDDRIDQTLRWVNNRDNRLHVRLQQANRDAPPATFFDDGYTQKLNYKEHPLLRAAQKLLASRDLHCVEDPEALRRTEHALTVEGTMSGRGGKFEKQDQRRLNEGWMTGFDNKDQLEALMSQAEAAREAVGQWSAEAGRARQKLSSLDAKIASIDQLVDLEFATIDLPGAEAELDRSVERLNGLLDPDSDASQAKQTYELARNELESIQSQMRDVEKTLAVLDSKWAQAEQERNGAEQRVGPGLADEELLLAEKEFVLPAELKAEELGNAEREARDAIDRRLSQQSARVTEIEQRLVRLMEAARRVDTGALTDCGSDIEDIPVYLDRLRLLNEEALPEKQKRFLEYLNRSSDQGVTQLLAGIREEVDAIEQRIEELNTTLAKVDFRSGRYLQLLPQRIKHERLRSLETAMRKVRSAALKDDEGESHYRALQDLVEILREAGENRRLQGSKALLDPRYRLQFFVVEVERATGFRSPPRTGSQSGSGGEKELMASHILTASLSYALCPAQASRPLYATVVLDEAFSKSSPSAASRIIEALRIFCLHPVFVTPNKEIGLLKQHTRKVICVQRPGKEASLASITWEDLDKLQGR